MKIYVNANAGRDGDGRKETPFRWINDAAKIALPGDEICESHGTGDGERPGMDGQKL